MLNIDAIHETAISNRSNVLEDISMTNIYLYVKTHNVTGLKYLGKTTSEDPHGYPGSGLHWIRHLKKHGYNYTTEILRKCRSHDELIKWGLYYSNLWNVVISNKWANLREEAGEGGNHSEESKKKMSFSQKNKPPVTNETRRKLKEAAKNRPPQSEETRKKKSKSLIGHTNSVGEKNGMFGKQHIKESRKKIGLKSKKRIPWNKGKRGSQVPWNKGLKLK